MIQQSPAEPHFRVTRSPMVWLGLFGLAFILWSWGHSMYRMAGMGRQVEIWETHPTKGPSPPWISNYMEFYGHSAGCLEVNIPIRSSTTDLRIKATKHKPWNTSYVPPDARWFPMPEIEREEPWPFPSGPSYVGTTFHLPHWILLLLYLSIWAAVMAWRGRRMRWAALEARRMAP